MKKLAIVFSAGHLEIKAVVGEGVGISENIVTPPTPSLSLLLTVAYPLGTNFFLSPAFRCHWIKDGGHNLR